MTNVSSTNLSHRECGQGQVLRTFTSNSSIKLMIFIDGATGADVKRAFTSNEVMTCPGSSLFPCSWCVKC